MECERIRASALWKGPAAAFVRPEAALCIREDGYATGQGGQAQYILYPQPYAGGGCEFVDGGNYKLGFGGGDDFSVDDLLDLGDGGGAEEASAFAAENVASCQGGYGWGHGKTGSSDSNSGLTSEAGAGDAEPVVPVGDITDLEWVSQFVDDSYHYVPPCPVISPPSYASASKHDPHQQRPLQFVPNPTSASASHSRSPSAGSVTSPVAGVCSLSLKRPWSSSSVLEDPVGSIPAAAAPCRKARSKRPRTEGGARAWALSAGSLLQEPLCSSASSSSSCSSTSSSFSSRGMFFDQPYAGAFDLVPAAPRPRGRPPLHKKHAQQQAAFLGFGGDQLLLQQHAVLLQREKTLKPKKKKGRKPKLSSSSAALPFTGSSATAAAAAEDSGPGTGRRCSHCGVQKTPQWRAGPMGAKTLCNACGVRYKSGRLLPEYRPACSPTFLSHVHSNSHRKVLEMRRNKELMQDEEPQQPGQEEQLLSLSASAAAAAVAVAIGPPASPPPVVTAQAMPAQQMVC